MTKLKTDFDYKGFLLIAAFYSICVAINAYATKMALDGAMAFTLGVFLPFIILNIIYLIYSLIRYKEVRLFTDWRALYIIVPLELLSLYGTLSQ